MIYNIVYVIYTYILHYIFTINYKQKDRDFARLSNLHKVSQLPNYSHVSTGKPHIYDPLTFPTTLVPRKAE